MRQEESEVFPQAQNGAVMVELAKDVFVTNQAIL